LGVYHECLARLLDQLGEHREAVSHFRTAIRADPDHPRALNGLAWLFATCPEESLRDIAAAVTLAEKGVAISPGQPGPLNTLGVAQYRATDFRKAISSLEKSIEVQNSGDAYNWFFLAMAREHVGEQENAHNDFMKAVEWMDKNKSNDPELRRFRAEAAVVLGIKDDAKPRQPPSSPDPPSTKKD
jgi:tetratricopeptide (TPR) repeat protein